MALLPFQSKINLYLAEKLILLCSPQEKRMSNRIHLSVLWVVKSHQTLRTGRNRESKWDTETICSSLRTGIRFVMWALQGLDGSGPGTYTSCCRQLGSTPPTQSYSCCPHSPQTRREHSGPSQARSTSAPAWHDMGLTQHEPNTRLRYVHTGKRKLKMNAKCELMNFMENINVSLVM